MDNLGDILDRTGNPKKIALVAFDDEVAAFDDEFAADTLSREFSYRAIDDAAMAVARALVRDGLRRGDRVAILSNNRAEYMFAYLGIMRAGMVAVPVNFKLPRAAIDHVLADSGAVLAFCDVGRCNLLPHGMRTVMLGDPGSDGFAAFVDPGAFETVRPGPEDTSMILYTSGSSGRPKGVPLSHSGQIWTVDIRLRSYTDPGHHRFLVAAPLYHMNGLLISLFAHAAHATEILLPQFRVDDYICAAERYRCTWLTSVPTMLALVTREEEMLAAVDLSSVEVVSFGSAPVTSSLISTLQARFPHATMINGYGTTESGPISFGAHSDGLPRPPISLGYPHPEVEVRLVGENGRDVDQGVLQIRSPAMMQGYHNLPGKTAEVITKDGFYITGDVMHRDESGFYYFDGRSDDMFVCGGENVFPLEVEAMLARHPAIHQACVVSVPDEIRGQMPVAFVSCRPDADLTEQEVKDFALANATPQEHPRRVFFVEALPLAGTNKIDRNALKARAGNLVR